MNRIVNKYGAACTPLAEKFSELTRRHEGEISAFIHEHALTPVEIAILQGIFGSPTIYAEERLRAQVAIRRKEKANPTTAPTKKLVATAEEARQLAIEWQHWASEQALSIGQLTEWQAYFANIALTFNLTDEFKENGII